MDISKKITLNKDTENTNKDPIWVKLKQGNLTNLGYIADFMLDDNYDIVIAFTDGEHNSGDIDYRIQRLKEKQQQGFSKPVFLFQLGSGIDVFFKQMAQISGTEVIKSYNIQSYTNTIIEHIKSILKPRIPLVLTIDGSSVTYFINKDDDGIFNSPNNVPSIGNGDTINLDGEPAVMKVDQQARIKNAGLVPSFVLSTIPDKAQVLNERVRFYKLMTQLLQKVQEKEQHNREEEFRVRQQELLAQDEEIRVRQQELLAREKKFEENLLKQEQEKKFLNNSLAAMQQLLNHLDIRNLFATQQVLHCHPIVAEQNQMFAQNMGLLPRIKQQLQNTLTDLRNRFFGKEVIKNEI